MVRDSWSLTTAIVLLVESARKKGERRLIDGPNTQHVFPIVRDVAMSSMAGTDRQLDEARLRAGYLCRFCYREFEKL